MDGRNTSRLMMRINIRHIRPNSLEAISLANERYLVLEAFGELRSILLIPPTIDGTMCSGLSMTPTKRRRIMMLNRGI